MKMLRCCIDLRNSKIIGVEPVIFLYMFATFMYFSLSQQYFYSRYTMELISSNSGETYWKLNDSICISISDMGSNSKLNNSYHIVQEKSIRLTTYISLTSRALSTVSTIFLGPFSDRFGRRPIFLIIAVGSILQGICGLLIVYLDFNLHLFILGAVLVGMCGDVAAMYTGALSYVADISPNRWRTARLAVAESMVFIAIMVSSGGSGVWFHKVGCHLGPPLILYIGCHAGIIVYTLLWLPESLKRDERRNRPGKLQDFLRGFQLLTGQVQQYKSSLWKLWSAFIPVLSTAITTYGSISVSFFFFKALNWDSVKIGAYFTTFMGSNLFAGMIVLPIMVKSGLPDFFISLIGVIFNCLAYFILGFSQETYQIFIIAVLQGMGALIVPPMRGLMSKITSSEDKGALFSVLGSAEIAGSLISILFLYLMPIITKQGLAPGIIYTGIAAFEVIAIPFIGCLSIIWCWKKCGPLKRGEDQTPIVLAELSLNSDTIDSEVANSEVSSGQQ